MTSKGCRLMSENLKITRASKNDSELVFLLTKELMAHHKMLNVFTMSISKLEILIEILHTAIMNR